MLLSYMKHKSFEAGHKDRNTLVRSLFSEFFLDPKHHLKMDFRFDLLPSKFVKKPALPVNANQAC